MIDFSRAGGSYTNIVSISNVGTVGAGITASYFYGIHYGSVTGATSINAGSGIFSYYGTGLIATVNLSNISGSPATSTVPNMVFLYAI